MSKKLKLQDYELGVTLGTGKLFLSPLTKPLVRVLRESENCQTQGERQIFSH